MNLKICILLLLFCVSSYAEDSESAKSDTYENVEFPYFKNGVIESLLKADKADAMDPTSLKPSVNLTGVSIYMFAPPINDNVDERPPLKFIITSKTGQYSKITGKDNKLESIAILKDNVVIQRFKPIDPKNPTAPQVKDATIYCRNAHWNHSKQILVGTGPVRMEQGKHTEISGTDFSYHMIDVNKQKSSKVGEIELKDVSKAGGWFELSKKVHMRTKSSRKQKTPGDDLAETVITSSGPGRYNMDTREVNFQDKVSVTRKLMELKSDFLSVTMQDGDQPVKDILAWTDSKTGKVIINGRTKTNPVTGKVGTPFTAHCQQAQYSAINGQMVLKDSRTGRVPIAVYGDDRISDVQIIFDTHKDTLSSSGGKGKADLRSTINNTADKKEAAIPSIKVTYTNSLFFNNNEHFALFTGNVSLIRDKLTLNSQRLKVELLAAEIDDDDKVSKLRIKQVIATEKVMIEQFGRKAYADKAILVPSEETERITLYGPPDPKIKEPGSFFEAKRIENIHTRLPDGGESNIIRAFGPGSGTFKDPNSKNPDEDATAIRFDKEMVYDQDKNIIVFRGGVIASGNEQVLKSRSLEIVLKPSAGAGVNDPEKKEMKKLTAIGDASLHWGGKHCEGERIVRDVINKEMYIYGTKERPASIWTENGTRFSAPFIKASENGEQIYSKGGGRLVMSGSGGKDDKAIVTYEGEAIYTNVNGEGKVVFTKDVQMRRGDMIVSGDEMKALMDEAKKSAPTATDLDVPGEVTVLPRRLKRMIVRGNVRIKQTNSIAYGSMAEVIVNPDGDTMKLYGSKTLRAEVREADGFTLFAPDITVRESTGIVYASGPGEVQIEGPEKEKRSGLALRKTKEKGTKYFLYYDKKMIYNSLAKKIRFEGNVKLKQDNVRGRCDILIVKLRKENAVLTDSGDLRSASKGLDIDAIDAYGRVRFKRFEPAPGGYSDDSHSLTNRPGSTVFTKSEEAHYNITDKKIILTGAPPQPQAIRQFVKGSSSARTLHTADKIWVDIDAGDVKMRGNSKSKFQPVSGAIEFEE